MYNCVRRYYNVFFVLYFVPLLIAKVKSDFYVHSVPTKTVYHQVETIYSWICHELELLDRFLS